MGHMPTLRQTSRTPCSFVVVEEAETDTPTSSVSCFRISDAAMAVEEHEHLTFAVGHVVVFLPVLVDVAYGNPAFFGGTSKVRKFPYMIKDRIDVHAMSHSSTMVLMRSKHSSSESNTSSGFVSKSGSVSVMTFSPQP